MAIKLVSEEIFPKILIFSYIGQLFKNLFKFFFINLKILMYSYPKY